MTTYRVERMTVANYNRMMSGSNNYSVETLTIEANSKEEAVKKAKARNYMVNENYVKSVEEIAEARAKAEAEEKAEAEKKAKAQATRIANEKAKAEAMGMTVEEYRAYKKNEAWKKRAVKRIAEIEEEIKKLKALKESIKRQLEEEA